MKTSVRYFIFFYQMIAIQKLQKLLFISHGNIYELARIN